MGADAVYVTSPPSALSDVDPAWIEESEPHSGVPALEPSAGGLAERFSGWVGAEHPIRVFLVALFGGFALLVGVMVSLGYVLIELVLPIGGLEGADQDFVEWLADNRTPTQEDVSWVGSTLAGGVVIPAVIGLCLLVFLVTRHWLLAAFVLFAVALESGTYRVTTLVVHRERPDVERLESLPVDASYPSGHTAASIALYGGLLLLIASRLHHTGVKIAALVVGVAIPLFIGWARMYRGMHHLTDTGAGILLGLGALAILVFAARAASAAANRRDALRSNTTQEVSTA
ncbi:MAG: phosphatase PAP2 family protein [Gaiellaceae bacterium]